MIRQPHGRYLAKRPGLPALLDRVKSGATRRLANIGSVVLICLSVIAAGVGTWALLRWELSDLRWQKTGTSWSSDLRASAGFDRAKLDEWREHLVDRGTVALLVLKRGQVVYEWYPFLSGPTRRHGTASLAKALVGGVSLMVALSDGLVKLDDPVWRYIPSWKGVAGKENITLRHLATHSSGIPHGWKSSMQRDDWEEAFWTRRPDPFSLTIKSAPVDFPPGTKYAYSGPAFAVLGYALTKSLQRSRTSDIKVLLQQRVMEPLGIPDADWSIGYGEVYALHGMRLYANWGGGAYTARATARVGQLLLNEGTWQGKEIVKPAAVRAVVSHTDGPVPDVKVYERYPEPAMGWWSNANGALPSVPRDAYLGAGAGHQILLVIPSKEIVLVRYGRKLGDARWGGDFWPALDDQLLAPLMNTIR